MNHIPSFTPISHLLLAGALFIVSHHGASADTLKLKDGTVLEGIASEITAESFKFQWRPSKSIKEERVFMKSEILELKVQPADEVAALPLLKLGETADLMSAAQYSDIIDKRLTPFLKTHERSKYADQVKKILVQHEEERTKVTGGWQKIEGQWITPEEGRWNRYIIEAKIIKLGMDQDLEKKQYREAADKLDLLKKDHTATLSFVNGLDSYVKLLDAYEQELTSMATEQPALVKRRDEQKKTLTKTEGEELMAEYRKNALKLKTEMTKDIAAKKAILIPDKYDPASIKQATDAITKERIAFQRLINEKAKYVESAKLMEQALKASGKANPTIAYQFITQVIQKLGSDAPPSLKSLQQSWKLVADEEGRTRAPSATVAPEVNRSKGDPAPVKKSVTPVTKQADPVKTTKTTPAPPVEAENDNGKLFLIAAAALGALGLGWMVVKKRRQNAGVINDGDDDDS